MTPKSESPWAGSGGRGALRRTKRDAVLRTAAQLFNSQGFHATRIDDVAERLNVTKPTIYHYFANKDEILFECVRRGLESVSDAVAAASGGSGAERLRALLIGYGLVMVEDFGTCVTLTSESALSPPSRARFRALKRQIDQMIRDVVAQGMADGSLRPGDPRLVTFTVTSAIAGISRWFDPAGPMSAQAVAEATVETLMAGIGPQEGP